MAPLLLAAAATFLLFHSATAQPSTIVVQSVTPNAVLGGTQTATVNGQITFDGGSPTTGTNAITCYGGPASASTATSTAVDTVYGTGTTSATATNPAVFNVTISTSYIPTGGTASQPVNSGLYEVFCRAAGPNAAAGTGVTSATSANLAVNPATQTGTPYSLTATIDKTAVTSQAGTSSVATISGTFTKPAASATLICRRVGPPGGNPAPTTNPAYTYTVNGVAATTPSTSGISLGTTEVATATSYSVSTDFNGVTGGLYTIRCDIEGASGAYDVGATAYSVTVMPPQIVRFGNLAVDTSTIQQPTTGNSVPGWTISGSVEFADSTTRTREIFCTSTTSASSGTPILIGQGYTRSLSTAARKDVDFSVIVGDYASAAPNPLPTTTPTATTVTGNAATCDVTANGDATCTFRLGNAAATTQGSGTNPTYTTVINDYGIQCYSGKIVSNTGTAAATGQTAILVDMATIAALRVNPTGVSVPTADAALTKSVAAGGENFVSTGSTTTAPTVSTTTTAANTALVLTGQTQAITTGTRSVLCKTAFSSPSQFSASGPIVIATGTNQQYSVSLPVPGNALSGVYSFRCLLNSATPPPPYVAVTDPSVNVTIAAVPSAPTSSPTAPTPTRPTLPTASPSAGPTTPTPPTPTQTPTRRPNPTPFPTKPRTPGPVPFKCSKDDEYRAPGGCRRCVSSESPFKQVFGGSVCVNPTTFSEKSTTCSTYTLQAFPRKDGTNDKTAGCISQKSQTISLLLVASPQSEVDFLSSASYRKTSLRLGTLRARSNRGLVIWVKKGKRQLVQFDDRYRTVRSQKGKSVKLTGTLRPYVGATLLRCFTAYLKVCDD